MSRTISFSDDVVMYNLVEYRKTAAARPSSSHEVWHAGTFIPDKTGVAHV
jgi:hypothetical protein